MEIFGINSRCRCNFSSLQFQIPSWTKINLGNIVRLEVFIPTHRYFRFRFPIPQKTQSVDFNLPLAVSSIRVAFYTPCFICFTVILC